MTGRRAGYCAGHDEPGFSNPLPRGGRGGFGRGGGWGRGRGFGGGPRLGLAWRHGWGGGPAFGSDVRAQQNVPAAADRRIPPEAEAPSSLDAIREELRELRKRMQELEGRSRNG